MKTVGWTEGHSEGVFPNRAGLHGGLLSLCGLLSSWHFKVSLSKAKVLNSHWHPKTERPQGKQTRQLARPVLILVDRSRVCLCISQP